MVFGQPAVFSTLTKQVMDEHESRNKIEQVNRLIMKNCRTDELTAKTGKAMKL